MVNKLYVVGSCIEPLIFTDFKKALEYVKKQGNVYKIDIYKWEESIEVKR